MTLPGAPPLLVPRAARGPDARLLSNGSWTTLLSAEGTGFAQLGWRRVTSWNPDAVEDPDGWLLYLGDEADGALWSLGAAPVGGAPERYRVEGRPGALRIERHERGIEAQCDVVVATDADAELRRIVLRNTGPQARRLTLTSAAVWPLEADGGEHAVEVELGRAPQ